MKNNSSTPVTAQDGRVPVLRDYQNHAVDRLRASFAARNRRVLFVLPTGGGKTVTFSYMVASAAAKGRSVLALAHRIEIVEQISEAFWSFGIRHGMIMAGSDHGDEPVQVGMIQTVVRRLDRLQHPDFVVLDEAHHASASSYQKILMAWPRAHVLGVTATPERTDGKGLGDVFESMVIGPSTAQLIERGALAPYRLFGPAVSMDLSGIESSGGDYHRAQLAHAVDSSTIFGDAVEHYKRECLGAPFVAFCVSVEHTRRVSAAFADAGIPCRPIDGGMGMAERSGILDELRSGNILGVASADLISEGFDLPAITAALMLRPTKSLIVHLQQIGRALRPAPGKTAVIMDHVGNWTRHGLPDRPREWSLEGRKRRAAEERAVNDDRDAVRRCRECLTVYPATAKACPFCGSEGRQGRFYDERSGTLMEVSEADQRARDLRSRSYGEVMRECRTVDDLLRVQEARGYKRGWVLRQAIDRLEIPFEEAARSAGYSDVFIQKSKEKDHAH